jgi:hypothetical protein
MLGREILEAVQKAVVAAPIETKDVGARASMRSGPVAREKGPARNSDADNRLVRRDASAPE